MSSDSKVFAWPSAGTRFGCVPTAKGRDRMTTPESNRPGAVHDAARQRDRRRGLGEILTALSRAIGEQRDPALMRGMLQQLITQTLPVRSVHVRTDAARWAPPDGAIESVAIEVPTAGAAGTLEATFEPGCRLGEWDLQLLTASAHVAALIVEIERLHLRAARPMQPVAAKSRRDGAAPLIGSTRAMHDL